CARFKDAALSRSDSAIWPDGNCCRTWNLWNICFFHIAAYAGLCDRHGHNLVHRMRAVLPAPAAVGRSRAGTLQKNRLAAGRFDLSNVHAAFPLKSAASSLTLRLSTAFYSVSATRGHP